MDSRNEINRKSAHLSSSSCLDHRCAFQSSASRRLGRPSRAMLKRSFISARCTRLAEAYPRTMFSPTCGLIWRLRERRTQSRDFPGDSCVQDDPRADRRGATARAGLEADNTISHGPHRHHPSRLRRDRRDHALWQRQLQGGSTTRASAISGSHARSSTGCAPCGPVRAFPTSSSRWQHRGQQKNSGQSLCRVFHFPLQNGK